MSRKNSASRKQQRREEAVVRLHAWRALSVQQQWDSLDERLGPGVGATRQRITLAEKLRAQPTFVEPSEPGASPKRPKGRRK